MAAVRKASSIDSNLGLTFNVQSTLFFFFCLPSSLSTLCFELSILEKVLCTDDGEERESKNILKKGGRKVWQKEQHTHTGWYVVHEGPMPRCRDDQFYLF